MFRSFLSRYILRSQYSWTDKIWVYTIWLCFLRNIKNCINVVPEKIILKDFFSMFYFHAEIWPPSPGTPVMIQGSQFEHFIFCTTHWSFDEISAFLERGFLNKSRHPNFTILWLFPTLKKVWQFTLTTLSSLGMHCTKFDWIWPSGSIED